MCRSSENAQSKICDTNLVWRHEYHVRLHAMVISVPLHWTYFDTAVVNIRKMIADYVLCNVVFKGEYSGTC